MTSGDSATGGIWGHARSRATLSLSSRPTICVSLGRHLAPDLDFHIGPQMVVARITVNNVWHVIKNIGPELVRVHKHEAVSFSSMPAFSAVGH